MNNRDTYRKFDEAVARAGVIIYFAAEAFDSCSDQLRTFMEDHDNNEIIRAFDGALPKGCLDEFESEIPAEDFFALLGEYRVDGFLVRFETPVRRFHNETACGYSWGHYATKWIYRPTLEAVLEAGLTWAAESVENDRRKAKKKTA